MSLKIVVAGVLIGVAAAPLPLWAACQPVPATIGAIKVERAKPGAQSAARVDLPDIGERLTITIPPVAGESIADVAACFDDTELQPDVDAKTPTTGVFSVVVPPEANLTSGMVPLGDHAVHVRWSYVAADGTKRTVGDRHDFPLKPVLTGVAIKTTSEKNGQTQVLLYGDGFDKNNQPKFLVVVNGQPRDVCWPNVTGCNSPPAIRGVVEGPHTIALANVDLSERSPSEFQVCYSEESDLHCSSVVPDHSNWSDHAVVLGLSIGVLVLIAAFLVLCVLLSRNLVVLWGQRYVISVLLLDKETDTLSLSKAQFYIWTAAAVFGYAYLTLSRLLVQHWYELPAVPSGLPGIVGIAAGTAVGAQVVTQINGPKGAGKLHPSLADLITTGDVVAAERVQYLVWTVIGAIGFFLAVAYLDPRTIVSLPDVPPSLLALSGLSAFGYLGGKLARSAGPVINEVIVTMGPDPDAAAGAPAPSAGPMPTPAWLQRIQTAASAINDAAQRFKAVAQTEGVSAVFTPTKTAVDAAASALTASAKLTVSSTAVSIADAKNVVDKQVSVSAKGADDAGKALATIDAGTAAAADLASSTRIAKIAQDAAKAVQDIQAALLTAAPPPPPADASAKFGLLELRGRMLSEDATFKISVNGDSAAGDFQLAFNRLQPSPKDEQHLRKPRVVEVDPDAAGDKTLAKRLLLVVSLDDQTTGFFAPRSSHTLILTNPDSQKVVFKYDVPESQKPS